MLHVIDCYELLNPLQLQSREMDLLIHMIQYALNYNMAKNIGKLPSKVILK